MTILLIDADIIAYRAASATDGRMYCATCSYEGGDRSDVFYEKYKKDIDRVAKKMEGTGKYDSVTVEITYVPEPLSHAIFLMKKSLKNMKESLETLGIRISGERYFLSMGGSFREKEFPSYKSNRKEMRRPANLEGCKQWLIDKMGAEVKPGEYEADDMMAFNQGEDTIICSIDKDMLQVPGRHFNFVKGTLSMVTEEEGMHSLYRQMLTGDSTDGIPGIKGIGPKSAAKLIDHISDPFLCYCQVLKTYLKHYKQEEGESEDEWKLRIVITVRAHARLLYLLRSPDDSWEAPERSV